MAPQVQRWTAAKWHAVALAMALAWLVSASTQESGNGLLHDMDRQLLQAGSRGAADSTDAQAAGLHTGSQLTPPGEEWLPPAQSSATQLKQQSMQQEPAMQTAQKNKQRQLLQGRSNGQHFSSQGPSASHRAPHNSSKSPRHSEHPSAPPPRSHPARPPAAKLKSIQPRLSIHTISNMASDDIYKIMYLMSLDEFMNRGPVTGDASYHGIAGIHGARVPYNGQLPGGGGFCMHSNTWFGPWHRPYCLLFEQHLRAACYTVANRFTRAKRKQRAKLACGKLRAPFWDPTVVESPSLLVDQTVQVYDSSGSKTATLSNPLQGYCFRTYAETNAGSKSPGQCMVRIPSWLSTCQNQAATFAGTLSAFLASRSWACTNNGEGRGCPGNLEMFHNNVHNTVGGDMATLPLAGWDPLFWLHHVNVDRMLFLLQTRANIWQSSLTYYSPFPANATCGEKIGQCGYSYGTSAGSSFNEELSSMAQSSSSAGMRRLLQEEASTTGGDPRSPQARAYLTRYLQELNGGYDGYRWHLVVDQFNPNALGNRTFGLHVLINDPAEVKLPMSNADSVDLSALRLLPNYCDSYSGFNTYMPEMATDRNTTIATYLNSCMQRMGISPNVPPLHPDDPTLGPSHKPLTRDQLRIVCIDSGNKDCTSIVEGTYKLSLGWDIMTSTFVSAAQTFKPEGEVGIAANWPAGSGPDAMGIPGPRGQEQYLYVKSEEF